MEKNKLKIAVDIDEVITKFLKKYLEVYSEKTGKSFLIDNMYSYDFWKPLNITKEEACSLSGVIHYSDLLENLELIEGSKEAINQLSEKHDIIFITSRPAETKERTKNFFDKIFPGNNFKIIHSGDFWQDGKSKDEICQDLGVEVILEDNEKYSMNCAERGIKVILFNKPWNQKIELHNNIIRVKNWEEAIEKINILNK